MKLKSVTRLSMAALFCVPAFASTYFGGVEDWTNLDYDYNDVVFSVSGDGLSLRSGTGSWFTQPVLGTSGSPFWNNNSLDGPNYNIGYCIYGGGNCNGGAALDSGAKFLADNATGKTALTNDVTFRSNGSVALNVLLQNTAATDSLGWYSVSDPTAVTWLNAGNTGTFKFTPNGDFGLVAQSRGANPGEGYTYYSQTGYGSQDTVSHFAFFGDTANVETPEPSAIGLLSLGLAMGAAVLRARKNSI
ncbi:MAG: PEP-CTERM sorting domain-containing protein [Acidobacteriota bacterium]|nr:PEP-CTERM sorting domain-containing protein [Acidobacteriota bacterium]